MIFQPVDVALARADLHDRKDFIRLLAAEVPPSWPPEFYDDDARRWVLLAADAGGLAALMYYLLLVREGADPLLIGSAGFKGPPSDGAAEIGYSIVPEWQGKGLGTEMVGALCAHAFEFLGAELVCAHTLPWLLASQRVLEKNGFVRRGVPTEPDALRYELTGTEWRSRRSAT